MPKTLPPLPSPRFARAVARGVLGALLLPAVPPTRAELPAFDVLVHGGTVYGRALMHRGAPGGPWPSSQGKPWLFSQAKPWLFSQAKRDGPPVGGPVRSPTRSFP